MLFEKFDKWSISQWSLLLCASVLLHIAEVILASQKNDLNSALVSTCERINACSLGLCMAEFTSFFWGSEYHFSDGAEHLYRVTGTIVKHSENSFLLFIVELLHNGLKMKK